MKQRKKQKMKIDYRYTDAKNGGYGVLGKGIARELSKRHELASSSPDIVLAYGVPEVLRKAREDYPNGKVIYYGVWESSKYQPEWAEAVKKANPNLVLVSAQYLVKVFAKSGIEAKVWHHGIDERWQFKERLDDGVYTFVHYNAFEWRKGWDLVLKAFLDEFAEDEKVNLILKGREYHDATFAVDPLTKTIEAPNVEVLLGHISDEAMVNMLDRADCGVFPVKGEGWFLPATECASCGIPVIMSNKMGMAEQFVEGYIDLEIDGWFNSGHRYPGAMIMPSYADLRKKMRWCKENEDKTRELGRKASENVKKEFNWDKVIREFEELVKILL